MRTPTVKEIDHKGYTINVEIDDCAESPRNHYTLGTVAASHSRYDLADDDAVSADSAAEFFCRLAGRADSEFQEKAEEELYDANAPSVGLYDYPSRIPDELIEEAHDIVHEHYLVIPVFMYEHSGVVLRAGEANPFHSPWDSGQVGWIYVPLDKIEDEYGDLSEESIDTATSVLQGEIETYSAYINKDVYGYQVEDPDGHPVEMIGCWGFFDQDYMIDEAEREIDATIKKRGETESA